MKTIVSAFCTVLIAIVGACFGLNMIMMLFDSQMYAENQLVSLDIKEVGVTVPYEPPKLEEAKFVVKNDIIKKGITFDWKKYVTCTSSNGIDLMRYVTMQGKVDTSKVGKNEVLFVVNWNGKTMTKKTVFYVEE